MMKQSQFLKIAVLALMVIFAACKKDETNNPTPSGGPFVAKVDGTAFPTTDAKLTKAKYLSATKTLQIIGQPSDQKEGIILTLLNFDSGFTSWKPGTYEALTQRTLLQASIWQVQNTINGTAAGTTSGSIIGTMTRPGR
ncbi:hypothetical protein MASR1M65_14800 [Saprospiraceae bacterium]